MHKTLTAALRRAGQVLRRKFGKVTYSTKARANLLTEADLESQRVILAAIRGRFPDHDILAEEGHASIRGAEFLWVVDPLDGTTNYAHGFPVFSVSIGVLRRGRPFLAGVYDPMKDECFTAAKGKGAFLNGERLKVSPTASLSKALLITGFPYDRDQRSGYYVEFYRAFLDICHDIRRSGTAALDMAWVAAGRADAFWEFGLSPWDVAAGRLLVSEAGGTVTDFGGRPWQGLETFGRQTLASNGRVHREMLGVIGPRLAATDRRPRKRPAARRK
ncbi:MAG: inositol monophosphatase [Elusimicrobia bacterium]|nr:inositol monophosphatase [Elusimicrobiota bacterium]